MVTEARVRIASALALVVLLAAAAFAQSANPVRRVGYLGPTPAAASDPVKVALGQGLRENGWDERRNLVIERRYVDAEAKPEDAAAELVGLKVEVVIAGDTAAAAAVRKVNASLPIVTVSGDPVEAKLAASYERPGGTVTGFIDVAADDWLGKVLALLKEAAPGVSRVVVLGSSANPAETRSVKAAETAAHGLGLTLVPAEARKPADVDAALTAARDKRIDALFAFDNALNVAQRQRIADFAVRHRLPSAFAGRHFVDAGGLLSYAPNGSVQIRRAAGYVDRILRGTPPGELPIQRPSKFELVVNARTAAALGLTVPAPLLARADDVIQ